MIAEAGSCGVTGLTHSLDLEGNTFIASLASLAHGHRATTPLNVRHQRHELSKKLARLAAAFARMLRVIRTTAILPGLHASRHRPGPVRPAAHISRARR